MCVRNYQCMVRTTQTVPSIHICIPKLPQSNCVSSQTTPCICVNVIRTEVRALQSVSCTNLIAVYLAVSPSQSRYACQTSVVSLFAREQCDLSSSSPVLTCTYNLSLSGHEVGSHGCSTWSRVGSSTTSKSPTTEHWYSL